MVNIIFESRLRQKQKTVTVEKLVYSDVLKQTSTNVTWHKLREIDTRKRKKGNNAHCPIYPK